MGVNCDWVSWVVYSKVENGSVSLLIICDCTVVSTVTYIRYKKYTFFYIFTGWARLNNLELKKLVLGKRKIEKSERNETKKKKKRNGHFFSRGGLWVEGTIIFNALPNSPLLLNYTHTTLLLLLRLHPLFFFTDISSLFSSLSHLR